jgi:two-component system, NtrC family, sensor kinase
MTSDTNRRILLVDDMPSIHEDFAKILAQPAATHALDGLEARLFGDAVAPAPQTFELHSAYQGEEGLQKVQAALGAGRPFSVAFVDMRMPPGWDGVETIEQLWKVDPRLQVVICTAFADHSWEEMLARLNVQDRLLILKKPFDVIEIRQAASMLSAKWSLERQAATQMRMLQDTVRELRQTESALRLANGELEGFAQAVSHDLRSPLISIGAFSKLLAAELKDGGSDKARHYLDRILAGALNGEQLVEGLLSLTRIARAELHAEPVDIGEMAREALDEHRAREPARSVAVQVQEGLTASGDRRLLRVALRHLIDNAWKFTGAREGARIEVGKAPRMNGENVFFVRDNGAGFDMAHADKLFRTFQRLHAADQFPGTGIGVITASRILQRHGGRIWAEARPGDGATFYFTLPDRLAS